ncbi:cytochrome P450 [Halorientalis regularis]|uniref:Cytochrome P450 n=1 Tax=Halorientalis regularis TaxID=660518 RepID=A0A1G7T797_9EURY|nr:cytochrome P450 [Halorientalis regularis]SDG30490.1 Cytochrome P450 [Halorientalis regularis]
MSNRAHSPPGLPVVGSVTKLARDPLRYLSGVQEAYGGQYPLVRLDPPGGQSVSVVLDASLVHDILADRDRFARPGTGADQQRRQGLLTSAGTLWEQQRSVLDPEFVGPRLSEYAEVAADTVETMLAGWPADGRIDLVSELSTMTMRVITRTLFSQDTTREQSRTVEEALSAVADEFEPDITDFLLPDRLQPGPSAAFEAANETLDTVARGFVDDHLEVEDPPQDMITALMEAKRDPAVDLSENELIDEAVLFMTAGQETTALTVTYAFHWLSTHPEARQRVADEARRTLDGDPPDWETLSELTYTEKVVRETLRLTPAAWNITRVTREPTTLAGVELPADEPLLLSTYAHHRDGRVWDAPETFDPDRWGETASRADDSYFPFGAGPRVCIGRQIALTEAQFALTHVLQQYSVETVPDSLSFQPGVTLRPEGAVRARVHERAPKSD